MAISTKPIAKDADGSIPFGADEPQVVPAMDMGSLNDHLGYLLRRLQLDIFKDFTAALADYNLRPGHYSVFLLVGRNPGRKQAEIGAALNIERAGVAKILNELENRGWVHRHASKDDGRSNKVFVTDKGTAILQEVEALAELHERNLAARLGKRRHGQVLKLLREIGDI